MARGRGRRGAAGALAGALALAAVRAAAAEEIYDTHDYTTSPEGDADHEECGLFWAGLAMLTSRANSEGELDPPSDSLETSREVVKMCPSGPERPHGCPDVAGLLNYAELSQYDDLVRGFCACLEGGGGSGAPARCSPAFDVKLQEKVAGISCTDFAKVIACDEIVCDEMVCPWLATDTGYDSLAGDWAGDPGGGGGGGRMTGRGGTQTR